MFTSVDWRQVFMPDTPLLEIFARGSLVYLAIFVLLRVFLRRQMGGLTLSDLLLVVLIADAVQNAMGGEYKSVPDGIFLVVTLIFWDMVMDWLSFRFPTLQQFFHRKPLPIIRKGVLIRKNLISQMISYEELMSRVREEGLKSLKDVDQAFVEGNGQVSIIPRKS